jgi:hypothetical protein
LIRRGRKTQVRRLATSPFAALNAGDTLWVQESCAPLLSGAVAGQRANPVPVSVADHVMMRDGWRQYRSEHGGHGEQGDVPDNSFGRIKWLQAVHMPRWASRLVLGVHHVHVESLQALTSADARKEGMSRWPLPWASPRARFARMWDATRGTPGERWRDNPDVVVIDFAVQRS